MTDFDSEKIKYVSNSKYIELSHDDNDLIMSYESVHVPFGLEKNFNNYILKIVNNSESKELFEKIKKIEQQNMKFLKKQGDFDNYEYKSQIIEKKNYGEFLVVKIPLVKNQFNVEIFDKDNNIVDIFKIEKKQKMNLCLEINSIWCFKNKYSCIPKITKIKLL